MNAAGIRPMHADPIGPWACGHVLRCLCCRIVIDLQSIDTCLRIALRRDQCQQPGARTDIEDTRRTCVVHPGAEEHAIGAHLHGATFLPNGELLETELGFGHLGWRLSVVGRVIDPQGMFGSQAPITKNR